jgi:hypothetical protein
MLRELEDFKHGIRPHADTLQGQPLNTNNFTVYWAGLRTLEVILDKQTQTLESVFHNHKDEVQKTRRSRFSYDDVHGVNVDGDTAEQVADELLKPLFASYPPSGSRG